MPPRRALVPVLVALALAACAGAPPTHPPRPGGTPRLRATATPGPDGQPPATAAPGPTAAPTAAPTPAVSLPPGVIATLTGRVKAPAGVLSNNGAGLISDKGGSIVSNNGGGYRLRQATAALEQFYVADAVVELVDAAGTPVAGFETTTDANGGYAFTQPLPARATVLRVTPPGAAGFLSRLVPRASKNADVDLATTLVASYVLASYVDIQADRQGTLEKLPADVEQATVDRAATALSAGALAGGGLPVALTTTALVDSAARLRREDAGFDTQMEVVRRLLIAAGVPNLGTGLPADKLSFPRFDAVHMAADGRLYVACADLTLWRIGPDGVAEHLAGRGGFASPDEPQSRSGQKALDARLFRPYSITADDQGRVLAAEPDRGIWRVEPAGTITQITGAYRGLVPSLPDQPTLLADGTLIWSDGQNLRRLAPGATAVDVVMAAPGAGGRVVPLSGGRWLVVSLQAAVVLEAGKAPVTQWARTDLAAQLGRLEDNSLRRPEVDQAGNVFYERGAELRVVRPDGEDRLVAPTSAMTMYMRGGLIGPDGRFYLFDGRDFDAISSSLVWRFEAAGGAGTRVAGLATAEEGFLPGGVMPLLGPNDMDVAADGTVWIADGGAILKTRAGGKPEVVLARNASLAPANEPLLFTGVRVTAAGRPIVRAIGASRELILRQTEGGGWEMPIAFDEEWVNKDSFLTMGFDAAPDGTIFVSNNDYELPAGRPSRYVGRILRVRPGAAAEELVPASAGVGWILKLAVQPDGSLQLATNQLDPDYKTPDFWIDTFSPGRWAITATGAVTELRGDALLPEAFDAQGRGYAGDTQGFGYEDVGDRRIRRLDGAAGIVVAGEGAAVLGGKTLDDSIGQASNLAFDGAGNLYIRDHLRRQIRRIAREAL